MRGKVWIALLLTGAFALSSVMAAGAAPDTQPPGRDGDAAYLVGVQWYDLIDDMGRLHLYFSSSGKFVEELVMETTWKSGVGGGIIPGFHAADRVYKGTYSISNGILTLTYVSAEERLVDADRPWKQIALPAGASFPYRLNMKDWDPHNNKQQAMLHIGGIVPPLDKLKKTGGAASGKKTTFWLNYDYTGGPMGYVKP